MDEERTADNDRDDLYESDADLMPDAKAVVEGEVGSSSDRRTHACERPMPDGYPRVEVPALHDHDRDRQDKIDDAQDSEHMRARDGYSPDVAEALALLGEVVAEEGAKLSQEKIVARMKEVGSRNGDPIWVDGYEDDD